MRASVAGSHPTVAEEVGRILVELKRQGLTGAEPRTRRRGLKLPAMRTAGQPVTAPGPGKAETASLKERN